MTGLSTAAAADTRIEPAIEAYVTQQLAQVAHNQGWGAVRHSSSITLLGKSQKRPACQQALIIESDGAFDPLSRQRVRATCPGNWQVDARVQLEVQRQAVHAARSVERGERLSEQHLTLRWTVIGRQSRELFADLDQVLGHSAKRRLRAGQLITANLLADAVLVRRGEAVTIIARQPGIAASVKGQALANGAAGEVIRVRNISSDKVIDAQVLEPGVVGTLLH